MAAGVQSGRDSCWVKGESLSTSRSKSLSREELVTGWRRLGVLPAMTLMVHSSLSSLGHVDGGAAAVVESLLEAVGTSGTVVVPTFTRQVADPCPGWRGIPDDEVRAKRDAVPLFDSEMISSMGAIPEAVRTLPAARRSPHPQASVAAVGAHATEITAAQDLGFALGDRSPFGRMYDLNARILLIGVGHNRNTFLHHVESLTPRPRLKVRRFPTEVEGERVWVETLDVGNDNDTYFPLLGHEYEQHAGISPVLVGAARCRLVPARELVDYAVPRLRELLEATEASAR